MKKYVLFAFIALFFVSIHSAWAAYVKLTAEDGTVSWIEIAVTINGENIRIYRANYESAIDRNTQGAIDLNEVWSQSGGSGTHYQVTTIGESAFSWCEGLTSVTIPNSVTTIGQDAFYVCSDLTSVTIPNSVTSIEQGAFRDCSGLSSVTIPNSVTTIGKSAFNGCSGLTSVTIPNSVTTIEQGAFNGCSGLTSVIIGNGVTSIEQGAFSWCSGLTSVTIPNSVTSIEQDAFQGCSGLTSVTIGNGVTTIGEYAFNGCSGLTSVIIPNSVTSIEAYAFSVCSGLTSVTIGYGVTSIGQDAFFDCTSVTDVYCHALPDQLTWNEFRCDDFNRNKKPLCHVYDTNEWKGFEGVVNVTFVGDLKWRLEANADNTGVMVALDNQTVDVELAERTFLTDGRWTTLCLPFSVTSLSNTPLEGFTVKELDTSTAVDGHKTGLENGTLYLNFKDATSIEAGKPYVVKKEMSYDISNITYISCTATSGTHAQTGFTDVTYGYQHLVDNKTNKYWRTNAPPDGGSNFCEFYAQEPVVVTRYELVSTNLRYTSNPTIWTLKGKLNEEDDWTVIDSRNVYLNPSDSLGTGTSTKKYNIATGNQGAYKYFRFDVTKNNGATVMVISDLKLYGAKAEITSIENPIFAGVTIKNVAPTVVSSNDGKLSFAGSFAPISGGKAICLGANNKLQPLAADGKVDALHAAFLWNGGWSDVNGDGQVDISDVVSLVNVILNGSDFSDREDVNGDSHVDISDVVALVNTILNGSDEGFRNIVTNIGCSYDGSGTGPARIKRRP